MGRLRILAIFLAFSPLLRAGDNFEQRLAAGRTQYFAYLQGDRAAADKARATFAALSHDYSGNAVVDAYSGSLELLDAAHTWAIWDKYLSSSRGVFASRPERMASVSFKSSSRLPMVARRLSGVDLSDNIVLVRILPADWNQLNDLARVVLLFDGRDAGALAAARAAWKDARTAGHDVTYWKETPSGKFEKQN